MPLPEQVMSEETTESPKIPDELSEELQVVRGTVGTVLTAQQAADQGKPRAYFEGLTGDSPYSPFEPARDPNTRLGKERKFEPGPWQQNETKVQ